MIGVPEVGVHCVNGHLAKVPADDVAVHRCCDGLLEVEDCPDCQEMQLHGVGVDFSKPGGIPQPDLWDLIAQGGKIH